MLQPSRKATTPSSGVIYRRNNCTWWAGEDKGGGHGFLQHVYTGFHLSESPSQESSARICVQGVSGGLEGRQWFTPWQSE